MLERKFLDKNLNQEKKNCLTTLYSKTRLFRPTISSGQLAVAMWAGIQNDLTKDDVVSQEAVGSDETVSADKTESVD